MSKSYYILDQQPHEGRMISVRPGYISVYNKAVGVKREKDQLSVFSDAFLENMANLQDNKHGGEMSVKASRKVRQTIDWMVYLAQEKPLDYVCRYTGETKQTTFKINFVTLSLSARQVHSDQVLKSQLLNQFLTEARQYWRVCNYLWRAEAQKNGNIHFHIVTDKFIPWRELRTTWNRLQAKLGYVDRFEKKHGHRDPNSVDVHSVRQIRDIARYLSKYCAKNQEGRRPINGKLWGRSNALSRMKALITQRTDQIEREVEQLKELFKDRVKYGAYFTSIFVGVNDWKDMVKGKIRQLFEFWAWDQVAEFEIDLEPR